MLLNPVSRQMSLTARYNMFLNPYILNVQMYHKISDSEFIRVLKLNFIAMFYRA